MLCPHPRIGRLAHSPARLDLADNAVVGGAAYWLWRWQRRRIAGLAGVALLASGALGFVTLAGLGARRADTAWDDLRDRARAEVC